MTEIEALIDDLGLVEVGSQEYWDYLRSLRASRYSRYWFCERVRSKQAENAKRSQLLCRELAKRNRKYSRYVHASFADSPKK